MTLFHRCLLVLFGVAFFAIGSSQQASTVSDYHSLASRKSLFLIVSEEILEPPEYRKSRPVIQRSVFSDGTWFLSSDDFSGNRRLAPVATGRISKQLMYALQHDYVVGQTLDQKRKICIYRYGQADHYIRHPPAITQLLELVNK